MCQTQNIQGCLFEKAWQRKMWSGNMKVVRRTCCVIGQPRMRQIWGQTGADKWHFVQLLRFLSLSLSQSVCVTGFVQHSSSYLTFSCGTLNGTSEQPGQAVNCFVEPFALCLQRCPCPFRWGSGFTCSSCSLILEALSVVTGTTENW